MAYTALAVLLFSQVSMPIMIIGRCDYYNECSFDGCIGLIFLPSLGRAAVSVSVWIDHQ